MLPSPIGTNCVSMGTPRMMSELVRNNHARRGPVSSIEATSRMIDLLLWPLIAGFVLAGIHGYFGMHVLARGIVFIDLSLAQVAALGLAVAILAGHPVQSEAAYWYGLVFALGGAALFALMRPHEQRLP